MVDWLNTDLTNVSRDEDPRLEYTIEDLSSSVSNRPLGHSLVCQVLAVYDSSKSRLSLLNDLKKELDAKNARHKDIWRLPEGDPELDSNTDRSDASSKPSAATYIAIIEDKCGQTAYMLCLENIPGINANTRLGIKIELMAPTPIRRGIFTVNKAHVKILGGYNSQLNANKHLIVKDILSNGLTQL